MINGITATNDFLKQLKNFGQAEKRKVKAIMDEARRGHDKLCSYKVASSQLLVRNKSSDDVPTSDGQFLSKIEYARNNQLWHIHAGFYDVDGMYPIAGYRESSVGDLVSDWVIHYQLQEQGEVLFIKMTPHPIQIFAVTLPS